jgi:hypothetical protein
MRRSIDDDQVPVPPSDDTADGASTVPLNWALSICDDYDDAAPRLQLLVEEVGSPGTGSLLHLDPDRARRLRLAIASALRELGEDTGR